MVTPPFSNYSNQVITGDLNHSPRLFAADGVLATEAVAEEGYELLKNWSCGINQSINQSICEDNLYIRDALEFDLVDTSGVSKLATTSVDNNVCPTIPPKLYDFIWTRGEYWLSDSSSSSASASSSSGSGGEEGETQKYAYRIYDETIELMVNGNCYPSKLSDHYPVVLTFRSPLLSHNLTTLSWCVGAAAAATAGSQMLPCVLIVLASVTMSLL